MREFLFFISGWAVGSSCCLLIYWLINKKKFTDIENLVIEGFKKLNLTQIDTLNIASNISKNITDQNQQLTTVKEQLENKMTIGNRTKRTQAQKRLASEKMKEWWMIRKSKTKEAQSNSTVPL